MKKPTPSVSILVPDISAPTLGAAVRIARAIAPRFPVQIVGPDLGGGVCSMYRGAFDYTVVPCPRLYRVPDFWRESRRLADAVTGDVVIAVKAYMDTIPLALRLRRQRGARAIVYLDEWDGAMMSELSPLRRAGHFLRHAHHPLNENYFPLVERLIHGADEVVSTTTFCQRRFGGRIIPLGADCDFFKPQPDAETQALRRELGLEGCRVVAFGGVARPHKGLGTVLEALALLNDPAVRMLIIGPVNDYVKSLQSDPRHGALLCVAGAPPDDPGGVNRAISRRMPLYLGAGDVLVVPLANTALARSQMPCKVFEAMAMGKPIAATAVSDLPFVLEGCGRVVPPDDARTMADTLAFFFEDPGEAAAMGRAAREKCMREFSADVVRTEWQTLIGKC